MNNRALKVCWGVFWFVSFALPIAFFLSKPGAWLPPGPLSNIYSITASAFGEGVVRVVFCGLWLALDCALFWRLVLSKKKADVDTTPIDGIAD